MKTVMDRPKVTCPHCGGVGKVGLSDSMFQTLQLLHIEGSATANQIFVLTEDKVGFTAIAKRLDDLFNMGLITRVRDGRAWRYSVKK